MKPSTFRFNYIKNKLNQIKNYNNYVLWFSDGVALYLSTHKKFNIRLVGFEFEFIYYKQNQYENIDKQIVFIIQSQF